MSRTGSYRDEIQGTLDGSGKRFAILVARFNPGITEELLEGARECLREHGTEEDGIEVYRVPGAWELPQAAAVAAGSSRFHGVIALGCVIRGETPHFDFISAETTRGLGAVARESGVPVAFGVLTTDTADQARERADRRRGNKGAEAALAVLELADVLRRLEEPRS